MRKLFVVLAAGALLSAPTLFAQAEQTLDMYFIDVEGGQAALYVSPTGESLLFDVGGGSPASNARDVPRIMEVIREAGVIVLDHVIISHYHGDHVGGAVPLSEILPVRTWYDHGGWTSELRSNRRAAFETWAGAPAERARDRAGTRREDRHHGARRDGCVLGGESTTDGDGRRPRSRHGESHV